MHRLLILILCTPLLAEAQGYARKLHLKKGEIFQLKGNHFQIDSLILEDGTELRLDDDHKTTELVVGYFQTGLDCIITGEGKNGTHGNPNATVKTSYFFGRTSSRSTLNETNGFPGIPGRNLILYTKRVNILGRFAINLRGGDGGNGAPHAREGGDGGNFFFSFPRDKKELVQNNLLVFNQGGYGGEFLVVRSNATSNFAPDGKAGQIEYIELSQ